MTKTKRVEVADSEKQAQAQYASIAEMVADLELAQASGTDAQVDEARERIEQDPLSVEVRTGWYTLDQHSDKKPAEYRILLCTGGPACQIVGRLSEYGELETARIEHQDWGTPWTEYRLTSEQEAIVLTYARNFYFGD